MLKHILRRAEQPADRAPILSKFTDVQLHETYSAVDRRSDFRATFESGAAGRRVLAQILVKCRVGDRSYVPGDSHETARREGQRDVGIWLLDLLSAENEHSATTAEDDEPSRPLSGDHV